MSIKAIFVISLIISTVLVPSSAVNIFGIVKCIGVCVLTCASNPFCLVPCYIKCKKASPLDFEGVDEQLLCKTGCAISNCITNVKSSHRQGINAIILLLFLSKVQDAKFIFV